MRARDRDPVAVRGTQYDSPDAAAAALGVDRKQVLAAKRRGCLDTLGRRQRWRDKLEAAFPMTIRGETFATVEDVAARFGISALAVKQAVRKGRVQFIGIPAHITRKRHGPEPMPVRAAGKVFPTAADAAKALGVSETTVRGAILKGREAYVGTGTNHGHANFRRGHIPPNAKQIVICGHVFASRRGACRDLQVNSGTLYRHLAAGDTEWLCCKVRDMVARRERAAIKARQAEIERAIIEAESEVKGRKITKLRGRVTASELEEEARAIAMRDARAAAGGWKGPGEKPHRYSPDYMAQGDCQICGHTREAHQ